MIAEKTATWVNWDYCRNRFRRLYPNWVKTDCSDYFKEKSSVSWNALTKEQEKRMMKFNLKTMEVDIEEDLSDLEKKIKSLQDKWISVSINYDWIPKTRLKPMMPYEWWNPNNVLVIWDLHEPYSLDWYLRFCRETQEQFDCWTVIYIWDIIDFQSISYHEKIVEELNPAWEIAEARVRLKQRYSTFPTATVLMGNHDNLAYRKARTIWIPREFIQDPNTIFQAPDWYTFVDELILDNVLYTHWSSSNAFKKCILEWINMVSWHTHTQCGVIYYQNRFWKTWWLQTWVGIDYSRHTFDYAKQSSKNPITACWVVMDWWRLPIIVPYEDDSPL